MVSRAARSIAALLTALLVAGMPLGGCSAMLIGDGTAGAPTGGTTRAADTTIASMVRSRLAAEPTVEASGIYVRSDAGRVTLSGEVTSYAEKDRAGRIAGSVADVDSVDNRLVVAAGAGR